MKITFHHVIGFALLALFWGGSFLGIRYSIEAFPPVAAAALRVAIATVIMLACRRVRREKPPLRASHTWQLIGIGFFTLGIPWAMLFWGQKFVMPAMSAILNSTTPLFTVLATALIFRHEEVRWNKWFGAAIGFAGVVMIFGPAIAVGAASEVHGMAAILVMALLYAFGVIWLKSLTPYVGPATAFSLQGVGALAFLVPFSLMVEWQGLKSAEWSSTSAWTAMLYLGIFSTAIAQLIFFGIIRDLGSVRATTISYLVPIVSVVIDFLVFGKLPPQSAFLGAAIILIGIHLTHIHVAPLIPRETEPAVGE